MLMDIKKILKWILSNPMEIIAGVSITLSVLITTINALTRYLLKYTWNPSTDIVILLFAYTVFCGAAAAYRRKMHYGIDIVVERLPHHLKNIVTMLCHIIMVVTMVFATWLSIDLMMHVGGKVMSNTKISYVWFDLSAVLGFGFMAFYEIRQTLEDWKRIRRKEAS